MIRHLADIASVGTRLVLGLKERGIEAELVNPEHPNRLRRHALRAAAFRRAARSPDPIHLHYALFVAYLTGRRPADVVHCHGSDIRPNLSVRTYRAVTLGGLRRAKLVLYSTPDLQSYLLKEGIRAEYLPNPVDISEPAPPGGEGVLIFMRLDRFKGAEIALDAARKWVRLGVPVTAIDWGELATRARAIPGLSVIPRQPRGLVTDLIARHDIVVGQIGGGFLSMSELEAMALGRPVVMRHANWPTVPDSPPIVNVIDTDSLVGTVMSLLRSPEKAAEIGLACHRWAQRYHARARVVARLVSQYDRAGVLSGEA